MARKRKTTKKACHMKRMGKVGTRCFCNGIMAKTTKCK